MRPFFAYFFAVSLICSPILKAQASDIATSVVVGIVVSSYAGALAGAASSMPLGGSAVVLHSAGKEAIAQGAHHDILEFQASGRVSFALQNSIDGIQDVDSRVSDGEAINLILSAVQ